MRGVLARVVKVDICLQCNIVLVTRVGFAAQGGVLTWNGRSRRQLELVRHQSQLRADGLARHPQPLNFTLQQFDALSLDADNSILVLENLCEVIRYSRAAGQLSEMSAVTRPAINRRFRHLARMQATLPGHSTTNGSAFSLISTKYWQFSKFTSSLSTANYYNSSHTHIITGLARSLTLASSLSRATSGEHLLGA